MVGLLFTHDHAFTVLPKIFRGNADASVARDVIACVKIYLGRLKRRLRHSEASEVRSAYDAGAKLVDLLLSLIDWTLDRGFHSEDFEAQTDESSNIDWGATMDHGIPLHVGRSVVYSEIIGRQINYQLGPLAYLQAQALLTLHRQLTPTALLWLTEHDPILDLASKIASDPMASDEFFITGLDELVDFLNVCNRDHDRELAGILFDWLVGGRRNPERPMLFGTTAFQYIWEDMCEIITGELGDSMSHKEIASQPGYLVNGTTWVTDGQRPDILRQFNDGIYILDAKWYDISNREWPGVQDVVKQIMYQASVTERHLVLCNAFLVPVSWTSPMPKMIGEARMDINGRADTRFPVIRVMAIPWKMAVEAYSGLVGSSKIANVVRDALDDGEN